MKKLIDISGLDRMDKVARLAKSISEGGWSSLYSFVDSHATDDELDEDEDFEEQDVDQ